MPTPFLYDFAGRAKKATSLLRTIGFQMPIELLQSGFICNITHNKQNVNMYDNVIFCSFYFHSASI